MTSKQSVTALLTHLRTELDRIVERLSHDEDSVELDQEGTADAAGDRWRLERIASVLGISTASFFAGVVEDKGAAVPDADRSRELLANFARIGDEKSRRILLDVSRVLANRRIFD